MLCSDCDGLTVKRLFPMVLERKRFALHTPGGKAPALSAGEFRASNVSLKPSFTHLVDSARTGCMHCALFIEQFKSAKYLEKIKQREERGQKTQIEVAIRCLRRDDPICTLDTLWVTCGKDMASDWAWPYWFLKDSIGFILHVVQKRGARKELVDWKLGTRQLDADLGSRINFDIARTWLSDCQLHHEACRNAGPGFMPTRLVDVHPTDPGNDARLIEGLDHDEPYAALSHCWGGRIDFKTTSASIEKMKEGMSREEMPPNFRDAVKITRELGIRYLWIDSLCIIQDVPTDWEKEAAKMGEVYHSATVTIAAAVAENSEVGILKTTRQPELLFEIPFDVGSGPENALQVYPKSQSPMEKTRKEEEDIIECVQNGVLGTRGWTLQERLLSRGILYYGNTQLFWSCRTESQAANGYVCDPGEWWTHLPNPPSQDNVPKQAQPPEETRNGFRTDKVSLALYEGWYNMMYNYTHNRHLTFQTDKLPALGGIAKHIGNLTGDRYLAGIWLGDLCRGLLWQRDGVMPCKRVSPPRGPSWSWVNFDGALHLGIMHRTVLQSYVEVVSYEVSRKGSDPYGEVSGGTLVLRAPVFELGASMRENVRKVKPDFSGSVFDYEDASEESGIWGSRAVVMWVARTMNPSDAESSFPWPSFLLGPAPQTEVEDLVQALVLREVDGRPNVFERIGTVTADYVDAEGEDENDVKGGVQTLTLI